LLKKYINRLEEACGEGREFIVFLKNDTMNEAINLILNKVSVEQSIAGILIKARYAGKSLSIFKTGKLVIREFHGKEEAEIFLKNLLLLDKV